MKAKRNEIGLTTFMTANLHVAANRQSAILKEFLALKLDTKKIVRFRAALKAADKPVKFEDYTFRIIKEVKA